MTPLQTLVDAYLDHHRAMGRSPDTIRHYHDSLKLLARCLEDCGIAATDQALTTATMTTFAGWLRATPTQTWRGQNQRSIYGVHGALKDIKAFVRWLHDNELLAHVPKVPVPKLPQRLFPILSDEDLVAIFSSSHLSGNSEQAIRNRALISFMLDTGVRLSEAANLALAQLDLRSNAAVISGKGNKQRMVYYAEGTTECLRRWLAIRGDDPGQVFWLAPSGIRMLIRRIREEVGLERFTAHQIRHTALTMLVREGVDLHTVKRLAGHASVTTTEAYLALAGDDLKDKHRTASPFDHIRAQLRADQHGRRRLRTS